MDKTALIRSTIAELEGELARQTEAALSSRAEATDADSRQEGKFDMRGQSAAYLAEGQSKLAAALAEAIQSWKSLPCRPFGSGETIALGALVVLETRGDRSIYLIGPQSGGLDITDGKTAAVILTPGSRLGRELVGKRVGDYVRIAGFKGTPSSLIVAVE